MTLIDTEHYTFAHLAVAEYPDKLTAMMPKMPEMSEDAKKSMPKTKTSVDSKKTGRTETILGIQAEEREIVVSIETSMPERSGVQMPPMTMKMVMQIWTAKPDESLRNQAVRELMGYTLWANYFMNPARMMEKMMASMPDHGDFVKSITEAFSGGGTTVMLRTRFGIYMSITPDLQKRPAKRYPSAVAADPNAPMFEMTQEAVEMSSAPVEESLFRIPAGYKEIESGELLKTMMQTQMAAMGGPAK